MSEAPASGNAVDPALEVVVAVLTYRRPAELARLLSQLHDQIADCGARARVQVVDNDPAGSAADVVEAVSAGGRRVAYVHETHPGIAAARNRALDEAGTDRVLVFIDDDETPSPGWLRSLLQLYATTGAAAVVGPVVSDYEEEPSPWIKAGGFFDRRRLRSGAAVDVAATNNLLLDLDQVRKFDLRFDERFGLSGGSDTLFTRQLVARGGSMVWCAEAMVTDVVPSQRLTRQWVLLRALRSGNSWSRTSVEIASPGVTRLALRARLTAEGVVRIVGGSARILAGVALRRMSYRAGGLRTCARGVGMLTGAYGYVYSEYRRKARP